MRALRAARIAAVGTVLAGSLILSPDALGGASTCGTAAPPEVVADADGWPLPNRDFESTRAQLASRIDTSTIADVEVVWDYPVPGDAPFGNLTTTPVVTGETVYVGALDGSMHAVDLVTGDQRWQVPRTLTQFGPSGVAVGWGKVFGISATATVVANDAATGAELWTNDLGVAPGNQIDVQPMVVGGCVLVATQGLWPGSRGTLFALDQDSGAVVWSFETVPDDFWGNPRVNHGGGSWYPPTVDRDRGLVYWGTSNPWPAPGASGWPAGSSRPGDNLYTDSVVALDLADGSLEWFDQAFPHDIWDRDMVLTQLVAGSQGADPVLVHTGKGGVVRGLDPVTGALDWTTPVGMHQNDDVTDFAGPLTVMPGVLGGVETPPASADGISYVAVMNAPSTYAGPEQTFNLNAQLGTHPGQLVGVDVSTGDIVLDVEIPGDPLGGVTIVNDVALVSTFQGLLLGYDRDTGEEVWRHEADGAVNGWPAVVGDTVLWPVSGAGPAELLAFRLPAQPPPSSSTPPSTSTTSPPTTTLPTTAPPVVAIAPSPPTPRASTTPATPTFTG